MAKIVTMRNVLRLSTPGHTRFVQNTFDINYGVVKQTFVSLFKLWTRNRILTKLPKHEIGQSAVNSASLRC